MRLNDIKATAVDAGAGARTLVLRGQQYGCPCCGASFRHFTRGGRHLSAKADGYCPRCNSKPRHRWLWMHLPDELVRSAAAMSVLHIAPSYSTYRGFRRLGPGRYLSAGLGPSPRYHEQLDLCDPLQVDRIRGDGFDVVVCIHVLEHLDDDRAAISGLASLVNPDGLVLVGVPIRDGKTLEDPSVTDPAERDALFGEPDHRRWYGMDVVGRLEAGGFDVETFLTVDADPDDRVRYGLKPGEGLFLCRPRRC
jgi:SAM-dependent methyltransferase